MDAQELQGQIASDTSRFPITNSFNAQQFSSSADPNTAIPTNFNIREAFEQVRKRQGLNDKDYSLMKKSFIVSTALGIACSQLCLGLLHEFNEFRYLKSLLNKDQIDMMKEYFLKENEEKSSQINS